MTRTAGFQRLISARLLVWLTLPLVLSACGKKKSGADSASGAANTHKIEAVGVKVTAPGDWKVQKRGSRWVIRSGMLGVFFSKHPGQAPKTPKDAAKLVSNGKILESEPLPGGGVYLFYKMKFPTGMGKPPMWLEYLRAYLPLAKGYAMCTVQLTSSDQKAQLSKICKSMQKL